jgi:hypothetical protein
MASRARPVKVFWLKMSDRTPAKINTLELASRFDLTLASPPADLPQKVPARFGPEFTTFPTGGRIYVVWRIPGRPGLHGIFYCREFSDLEARWFTDHSSGVAAAAPSMVDGCPVGLDTG